MTHTTQLPIFDGHNDFLLRLFREPGRSFFERHGDGHIDLPRAREGGLAGGFCAVYIPAENISTPIDPLESAQVALSSFGDEGRMPPTPELGYAQRTAMAMMATLFRVQDQSQGQIAVVHSASELEICLKRKIFAAVLHIEGAEPIDPELNALEVFYKAGLRSIGIVHSRPNAFAHGVPFKFPHSPDTGPGLTMAGRELVRACNRLGVMIDLSHINEQGFWEVAGLTDAPLVATHSNAHAITPSTRNLTDKQLDAIRESDGMVGVNFHVGFLRQDGEMNPDTPLEAIVRHVDYLVDRIGIERVGFGSDFDGAAIPAELRDAAGLPKVLVALREAGYDTAGLKKLTHQNWLRFLRQSWKQ